MLLSQFPDVRGLQSTLLGESLSFRAIEPQILHVGDNHWMTVLAVDNNLVKVYDSMYSMCFDAGSSNVEVNF